jgi:hypothetical protein
VRVEERGFKARGRGGAGGIAAAGQGHDVVMSPTSHCYLDYYQGLRESEPLAFPADLPLHNVYQFEPVPPGLEAPADSARILSRIDIVRDSFRQPGRNPHCTPSRARESPF